MSWLNKKPIFYNLHTQTQSENINDVIDFGSFDWDVEGLKNFLDFGFCVFGHTPIKNVRFIQANQSLRKIGGRLEVHTQKDPFLEASEKSTHTHPDDIHQWMYDYMSKFDRDDKMCLPLSGGYDSRYIAAFLSQMEFKNVRAFSFGISRKQSDSFEVIRAQQIARRLKIPWERIDLNNVFKQTDKWYELFGSSTHLHGHHQIHFYNQIANSNSRFKQCLSGLIGDAWTGKISIDKVGSPKELVNLGLTHGLAASSKFQRNSKARNIPAEVFFEENKERLKDSQFRIVTAMRIKMMLLRYLEVVPNSVGMETNSPFTELDFVIKAFNLASDQRVKRKWQVDFFRGFDLMPEEQTLKESKRWEAQEYYFLRESKEPINAKLLGEIYDPERVDWVNRNICNTFSDRLNLKLNFPFRGRRFLLPFISKSEHKTAFSEYYTLWPLQKLIERRNEYLKSNGIQEAR